MWKFKSPSHKAENIMIEFKILSSDTILNYQLSQKFKLLGYGKFNHLTVYF